MTHLPDYKRLRTLVIVRWERLDAASVLTGMIKGSFESGYQRSIEDIAALRMLDSGRRITNAPLSYTRLYASVCRIVPEINGLMTTSLTPLNHADRQALGLRARKQIARSEHANFRLPPARKTHSIFCARPCAIASPAWSRISISGWLPVHLDSSAVRFPSWRRTSRAIRTPVSRHNFVVMRTSSTSERSPRPQAGWSSTSMIFDETIRGPFEYDVKRLATSLILAGREAGVKRAARRDAVLHFTEQYRNMMHTFAAMPVLELARSGFIASRRPGLCPRSSPRQADPRRRRVSRHSRSRALPNPTAQGPTAALHNRGSFALHHLLERLSTKEAAAVLAALGPYERTLQPERRHFLEQYAPQDVAFKVVGTGSVGLRDYVIYFEGLSRPHGVDPLFLQIKEEPASAYAPYLPTVRPHAPGPSRDGRRARHAIDLGPFTWLYHAGGPRLPGAAAQRSQGGARSRSSTPGALLGYADLCGELLARGHARAGDPVAMAAYLGSSNRFDRAILGFAGVYADKTEHNWQLLKRSKDWAAAKKLLAKA